MSIQTNVIMNWIPLVEIHELDLIKSLSEEKTVVIFKHSTRCGISRSVLSQFEKATASIKKPVAFYFLDLLNFRSLSNEIASTFDVYHQSPQLLVIKNNKCVANFSHYDIISEGINEIEF